MYFVYYVYPKNSIMFPWEIIPEIVDQYFSWPYLFFALYRIYKGAYYGQGFQLGGTSLHIPIGFQANFDKLPLDVKGIILSKIWDNGKDLQTLKVLKGKLLLHLRLQFLFAQYGQLQIFTQSIASRGCGAWNSYLLKKGT